MNHDSDEEYDGDDDHPMISIDGLSKRAQEDGEDPIASQGLRKRRKRSEMTPYIVEEAPTETTYAQRVEEEFAHVKVNLHDNSKITHLFHVYCNIKFK